jgi:4-amino-4-deoxy-L-arabinose transferase-like glycosyltransferase
MNCSNHKSNSAEPDSKQYGIFVFFTTLMFYMMTMAPTVIWGDSADFALKVHDLLLDPAADGHPLYVLLGRVFSWLPGELAVNLNFMSVFFAALAVLLVYLITERITGWNIPAAVAAVSFTLSHTFWLHSATTEVYTVNAFFVALIIWLLLKWKQDINRWGWLYGAFFVFGLSLSHHLIIGLGGLAGLYLLMAYGDKRLLHWRRLLLLLLALLIGSSLYWGLLLRWLWLMPQKSAEIADIVTGRGHKQFMFSATLFSFLKNVGFYLAYLGYQFPGLGIGLGFWGVFRFIRDNRRLALFFLILLLANTLFFITGADLQYNYQFLIHDYLIFSIMIGYGSSYFLAWLGKFPTFNRHSYFALLLLLGLVSLSPILTYQVTPWVSKRFGIRLAPARPLPYRNNEEFFLQPSKAFYYGPRQYAQRVFKIVEPNSILIADFTPAAVLEYYQRVLGVRPDVELVYVQNAGDPKDGYELKPYIDKKYGRKPIYLADFIPDNMKYYYNMKKALSEYKLVPLKPVYKVVKAKE